MEKGTFIFTAPAAAPIGHRKHSGQRIVAYADPIYEPGVFRIVARDGWEGLAFASDLSEAEGC